MKKILLLLTILLLAGGSSYAAAGLLPSGSAAPATLYATVNVSPGTNTIANAVSAHGGSHTYLLANGTYTENVISVPSNVQFIGSGAPNVLINAASGLFQVGPNSGAGSDFVTIWGLTIDLGNSNGSAVGGNCSDFLLQNVHVQNYSSIVHGQEDFPIYLFVGGYNANNQTIDHCQFTQAPSGSVDGTTVIATGAYRQADAHDSNTPANYTNVSTTNNLFDTPTDTGDTYYHCCASAQTVSGNVFVAPNFSNGFFWYQEAGSWDGNPDGTLQSNASNTSTLTGNTVTLAPMWSFAGVVSHTLGINDQLVVQGNTIHGSSSTGAVIRVIGGQGCPAAGFAITSLNLTNNSIDAGTPLVDNNCDNGSPWVTSPNSGLAGIPVQHDYSTPQSTSISTVSEAYAGAQTAGDLNIVAIGYGDTAGTTTISSVTDSKGNTYSLASGLTRGTGIAQSVYYCSNIVSATSGSNTVTVTFSGNVQYPDLRISEFSGTANAAPDVTAAASGSSTSVSSGSATTTNATDLIYGAAYTTGVISAPGMTYNTLDITSPDCDIHEYEAVNSTGSYSVTATDNGSPWVAQMVAFKAGSSGVPLPSVPGTLSTQGYDTPVTPGTLSTVQQ